MLSEGQEDTEGQLHDAIEDTRPNRHTRGKAVANDSPDSDDSPESEDVDQIREDDDLITLKDRQSLINVEHPFGLRIWKPALYRKSRSITRNADAALHSIPSAQAERHLLPGNIFWVLCFGWWLAVACFAVSAILHFVPLGGRRYSTLVFGLGWYVAWPFGKYVEGDSDDGGDEESQSEENNDSNGASLCRSATVTPLTPREAQAYVRAHRPNEDTSLLSTAHTRQFPLPSRSYGAAPLPTTSANAYQRVSEDWLGRTIFWIAFCVVIAPLMLFTCIACWALIITIPMAKLNWALIKYLVANPTRLRFCAPPPAVIVASTHTDASTTFPTDTSSSAAAAPVEYSVKHPRLSQGQTAPSTSGLPKSTVLLCVYRGIGWNYYKYTVGGVNIFFINLLPFVFFVIFDGFVLLPLAERTEHVPAILAFLTSQSLIFIMSLASVIPLSYFIGMAVASISAQSSIGMGAVINATFGSIIEVILYSIALTQGKGHLVEGSIVGSLLAGVLLMPGTSMCVGALRKKEQKFNAKSAGVTSMMLIMAFIGTLTPTLFYQIYGNFQLVCSGCPDGPDRSVPNWKCDHCYYQHPDPVKDPFYQSTVKSLMYFCAVILLFSYLVGLWFSLRTHATQIWQNPQPLLHSIEIPPAHRLSGYQRTSNAASQPAARETHKRVDPPVEHDMSSSCQIITPKPVESTPVQQQTGMSRSPVSPSFRRVSYAPPPPTQQHLTPLMESVDLAIKNTQLPESLTKDDFARAVAVATVSALRHQQGQSISPARFRTSVAGDLDTGAGGHAGHEAPEWSRTTSAAVLLVCTALYAIIADLLIDVVDFVLKGSGIDEKFLGITLFALVPNTTEFMNAISFALNENIALSMEIGSAYALQVCLLQIPAMVAFSAWYAPEKMGEIAFSFTLIFPRWDVVVIILAVFLMTYTYIEAKSNYHRGSILILSYLVLVSGFYFAPRVSDDQADIALGMESVSSLYATTQFLTSLWS
jgi:Ca2+:H+ antiporter